MRILPFALIFFTWFQANSQDLDKIIQSNRENLLHLYGTRGAPSNWVLSGKVDEYDIQQVLKEYSLNVGLLIYNYQKDTLQTILIDKHGRTFTNSHLIPEEVLFTEIDKANKYFSSNNISSVPIVRGAKIYPINDDSKTLKESYEYVSKILLPYDEDLLKKFDHLVIVPTKNIATLPFTAIKISDEKYLIDVMSYSIAPSLYEFMVTHQMKKNRRLHGYNNIKYVFQNALFVANPQFPMDSVYDYPGLPGTEIEVNYITNQMDSSTYTKLVGEEAKISKFKEDICDYDLLYFATHGVTDEENPLDNSFLVFAEDSGHNYLTAREIQNVRYDCTLSADLVILSACQTGLGQSHKAGLIGISRGFQIAGANHVLMSLWNISDNETAKLMGLFFDNLMEGGELMPHSALRKAILTYKSSINSNPNYWGAFSIFGIPY